MIFLSHTYNSQTPGFGGATDFKSMSRSAISEGRSSNSLNIEFSNHVGTHVDLPFHFDSNGKTLSDYAPSDWIFKEPRVLNLELDKDQLIQIKDLKAFTDSACDLLLVRSGFEERRHETSYWKNNPGWSPECGHFLRSNFPKLRAVGFDFISLTAFQHRDIGREAHRTFLSSYENRPPLWIVEDMKLSAWTPNTKTVILAPLLIENADGTPVTAIGLQ